MHAAFSTITANTGPLIAEMGERAKAAADAEAMLTIEIKPCHRRILSMASRPG